MVNHDKEYLRELAKRHMQAAKAEQNKSKEQLWYSHNALKPSPFPIVVELDTFYDELAPELQCEHPIAREIEGFFRYWEINNELICDDKVIPDFYPLNRDISFQLFGINPKRHTVADSRGKMLGYSEEHPIADLERDVDALKASVWSCDSKNTEQRLAYAQDVLGCIMPVIPKIKALEWFFVPTKDVTDLMGMENMLYGMIDRPDYFEKLMSKICDDKLAFAQWLVNEGLLNLNNGNDYVGSGSYGFTKTKERTDGTPKLKDLWVNTNSQESVGISPDMFGEMIFPHYKRIADDFGFAYYGCCEPVHDVWDKHISTISNLRKVSISPWCNEEIMGERLKNSNIIYSRKPSPNFIGIEKDFDENAFKAYISKTLKCADGCKIEFIFRDIYTLVGDVTKPKKAVNIIRELIK